MSIEFVCPTCRGTLRVGDESAGRVIRCGACLTTLRVPDVSAEPAPDAADALSPPEPPASPFGGEPEAPAAAVPVARPRARTRSDDRGPDRPRRRRRPPPPPGRGVLFWLAIIGGVIVLLVGGCCGGLYLAVPGPNWRTHESAKGGFKVDLPAAPRPDMDKIAGNKPDPNMTTEGTILFRALEEYAIVHGDIPPQERQWGTDKERIDAAVDAMKASGEVQSMLSQKDITVGGFPGREVEFSAKGGGYFATRVIIADGRVYVLVAGGRLAKPGNANVRRFLDSFEITDPRLKAEGQRRLGAERARADAAERARAGAAELAERQAREREQGNTQDAARAAVAAALDAGDGERDEVVRALAARERELRDIAGAGERSAETVLDVGDATRRAVLEALEALRSGAEGAAGLVLAVADREQRAAAFVFGPGRYTGRAPGLPAKPVLRLAFDGTAEQRATVAPGGKRFDLPAGAEFADGPSGTALYLPPGARADLSKLPAVGSITNGSAHTVSAWFKTTAADVEVFRFGYKDRDRTAPLSVRVTGRVTYVQEIDPDLQPAEPFAKLTAPSLADGRWHHVAVTREAAAGPGLGRQEYTSFYVDGKRLGRFEGFYGWDRGAKLVPVALAVRHPKDPKGGAADDVPDFAVDEVCVFAEALSELSIRELAGLEPLPQAPAPRPAPPLKLEPTGAKLPYHTAAVFDPGRNELWLVDSAGSEVFGAKITTPHLRRYSLPDLKEVGRYELPLLGSWAAFDPKSQRLYLAGKPPVAQPVDAVLALFDLSNLEPNDGTAPPKLKPLAESRTERAWYSALALAADGKHLYAVRTEFRVNDVSRIVLHRFATDLKGAPKSVELDRARSVARFATGPAGGLLVITGAVTGGLRYEIDEAGWGVSRVDRLAWGGQEWAVTPGGRVFVCGAPSEGGSALGIFESVGAPQRQWTGRNGHLALSPDGRYLYLAALDRNFRLVGISVLRADGAWDPSVPLTDLSTHPVEKVGGYGPMTVSGDGRWILFRNGGLVRVTGAPAVREAPGLPIVPRPVPAPGKGKGK